MVFVIFVIAMCTYLRIGTSKDNSIHAAMPVTYSSLSKRKYGEMIISPCVTPHKPLIKDNTIRIVQWTSDPKTNITQINKELVGCKLPENKNCLYVPREEFNQSEGIIFQGQRSVLEDMPPYRFPYQKWIFFEFESPPQTWIRPNLWYLIRNSFNLTSTYSNDSDVPLVGRNCEVDEMKYKELQAQKINYAKGKGSRVAWFVSHCKTQSKREQYVTELSKHIPVDIWGRCGKNKCGSKQDYKVCDATILSTSYKFYLSFENSICDGYVTEKMWRLILKPITTIPIVMGGANNKSILPNHTYINVKDFPSPKDLADFLKRLDKDDKEFNEYITKKNSLRCPAGIAHQCSLCKFLHEHREETLHAPDVMDFWSEERRCTPPEVYYDMTFYTSS